ncbi:MAG: pyridoxal phosphate-dependent aminotransferase [Promethearchaeota archaeon]
MIHLAERTREIKPFIVMTLLEKAKELEKNGHDIVHLEIGEPYFKTPVPIQDAAINAIKQGKTHYTHSLGKQELREAIASYKHKSRKLKINPDNEIMITAGSSAGFFIVLATLINPGDEVIMTDPGYPCYKNFVKFFGGKPITVPVFEKDKFDLNIDEIRTKISQKTKAIILNSPSNPTGQIISEKNIKALADILLEHDIFAISDEIYAELTYSGKIAPSISEIEEMKTKTIILDGFSKYWAMTGWRLGYIIAHPELLKEMNKVNQNFLICAPSISQEAAIKALECEDDTRSMLALYKKRRNFIIKRIKEIEGLSITEPAGAFYAFTNIKNVTNDSLKFAFNLLEKGHVAGTPGIGFGTNGEGYIRFSFTNTMEKLEDGMNRLEIFLNKMQKNMK